MEDKIQVPLQFISGEDSFCCQLEQRTPHVSCLIEVWHQVQSKIFVQAPETTVWLEVESFEDKRRLLAVNLKKFPLQRQKKKSFPPPPLQCAVWTYKVRTGIYALAEKRAHALLMAIPLFPLGAGWVEALAQGLWSHGILHLR